MSNPLLEAWDTPHEVPPFDRITEEHYLPAFDAALAEMDREIEAIATSTAPPTFENTIEAFEASGTLLGRIAPVFFVLVSAHSNDRIREIQKEISPKLAAHRTRIYTRKDLFERVEAVYQADQSHLDDEQKRLLGEVRKAFVRAGAALDEEARREVMAVDEALSTLQTAFGQNILKDANNFELVLETEDELRGLPESVRKIGADEAERRGKPGKYVYTISRSSITPFLQYSDRRDLREAMWRAYTRCGDNGNDADNNQNVAKIAALRAKRAKLLGYESHADYMLDDRMAGTPRAVTDLLDQVWTAAKKKVREEADDLQERIQKEGGNFTLAPWDWWYYTEKVRADKYALSAQDIKPYFSLPAVRQGAFDVAGKLYGLKFKAIDTLPTYHDDVEAFEVIGPDDRLIGIFLTDYYSRPSKRAGAWMNAVRKQHTHGGKTYPVVFNTCNFNKSNPTLLDLDEVRTVFHEFGHALHGLMSKVKYDSLSGTAVKRDFVELPSQIMEHWAVEPEVMKTFAKHYETGETIPDELIDKILAAQTFNQGFATMEYLAASYLDMKWHALREPEEKNVAQFEDEAMREIDLAPEIAPRYRSTYFQHIFSGGYSAGYYSYIWAEVLDADAYEAFKENGIFDEETAAAFREHVLERGGTADPMELYKRFRGREPEVTPLLEGRGLS